MQNSCRSSPRFHTDVVPLRRGMVRAPSFCPQPSSRNTSLAFHRLCTCSCCPRESIALSFCIFTFVFGRRVALGMELCVCIASMLYEISLIVFPAQSKGLPFWIFPWVLVKTFHVVPIRSRLFLCVPEDYCWDGLFLSLPKGTAFGGDGGGYLWLEDISVVGGTILEPVVLGETVFVGSVPPGGGGLVPLGRLLGHFDVGIAEQYRGVGPVLGVEVGALRLVAAHMVGRDHTLVFLESLLA